MARVYETSGTTALHRVNMGVRTVAIVRPQSSVPALEGADFVLGLVTDPERGPLSSFSYTPLAIV